MALEAKASQQLDSNPMESGSGPAPFSEAGTGQSLLWDRDSAGISGCYSSLDLIPLETHVSHNPIIPLRLPGEWTVYSKEISEHYSCQYLVADWIIDQESCDLQLHSRVFGSVSSTQDSWRRKRCTHEWSSEDHVAGNICWIWCSPNATYANKELHHFACPFGSTGDLHWCDVNPMVRSWDNVCLLTVKNDPRSSGENLMGCSSISRDGVMDAKATLNIKMSSYQYRDSHVKDKTVSQTVLSLT